jgi:hypothetical protein
MLQSRLQGFKQSPILEFPVSIYQYLSPSYIRNRQLEIYQRAINELNAKGELTEELSELIKWYSRIVEYILRLEKLSFKEKSKIAIKSPYSGFKFLTSDYDSPAAQIIETSLLARPEYICKLLLWANQEKAKLRFPLSFYQTLLYSDFYWASYYNDRVQTPYFFERMIKYNLEHIEKHPSSVLFLACMGHIKNLDPHIDQLSQDYCVAFQTAILFNNSVPLDRLLFEASLEPQWAYHILTSVPNLPPDIEGMAQSTLQYSPPWLIEYLHRTNGFVTNPAAAKERLMESIQLSGHALSSDIKAGLTLPEPKQP